MGNSPQTQTGGRYSAMRRMERRGPKSIDLCKSVVAIKIFPSPVLIFTGKAGLFSAVVTAFVIESYKFLQPSPNDAVVGLLFQIANSLKNTSSLPPSVDPASITTPFSPTSSAIRLNVFFFLSLILSLTTVLIGTISLQWLREHQSYPNLSPKEKAAILHMRSEALETWYVPVIFSALPLLLQGALVLFLAGLVDFSLPLGLNLIIPVSVVVGLTLLFLGTTTVLPAFQGLSFFLRRSYKHVPTPFPFKSPQSHAFRILAGSMLYLLSFLFSKCYLPKDFKQYIWEVQPLHQHPCFPFVYTIWHQTTWLIFDREWLSLRDACHQSILDHNDPHLYHHRENWFKFGAFPISDLTQIIIEAVKENSPTKYMESFFGATVHCFREISASIWTDTPTDREALLQCKVRHNYYFEKLHLTWKPSLCSMSNFLLHSGSCKIAGDEISATALEVFNQDQMFCFLDLVIKTHRSPKIYQYQMELWLQIISNIQRVPLIHPSPNSLPNSESTPPIPTLLDYEIYISMYHGHSFGMHFDRRFVKNLHINYQMVQGVKDLQLELICSVQSSSLLLAITLHKIGHRIPYVHTPRWLMCFGG
jgi:hypothetical protein